MGFANVLYREMIGRYFKEKCTIPFAIAQSGGAVGYIVFAPLAQLFLDTYGWRAATILLGTMFLHLFPCGALIHLPIVDDEEVKYTRLAPAAPAEEGTGGDTDAGESGLYPIFRSAVRDLFTSGSYWLMVVN